MIDENLWCALHPPSPDNNLWVTISLKKWGQGDFETSGKVNPPQSPFFKGGFSDSRAEFLNASLGLDTSRGFLSGEF